MPRHALLATLALAACAHAPRATKPAAPASPDAAASVGYTFVGRLSRAEFEAAEATFDDRLQKALPPDALAQLWIALQKQVGNFEIIEGVDPPDNGQHGVFVRTRFEHQLLHLKLFLDDHNRITGFFYGPATQPSGWTLPRYADDKTIERPITVGTAPALPGHLTLPAGKGPFPLAILIHGDGPGDEDETLGDNKPFKDLALGLAAKGVAVLRYDKRTRLPEGLPKLLTIRDEYFGSVADALALARHTPEIDPHRIALVGHSRGAMIAPWLAKENPGVAGVALLAGPVHSALDDAVRQLEQIQKAHPYSQAVAANLEELRRARGRAASPDLKPDEMVFHAPGSYWLSLRGYDPVATAAALDLPILIAQGERDYNVLASADYPLWQAGLAKRPNATFKLYPKLNHLFIEWGGTESVEDNAHPGHVAKALVDDLATWIAALPPR